jgi:hypothetical protein
MCVALFQSTLTLEQIEKELKTKVIVGINVHENYCEVASMGKDGKLIERW